MTEGHDTDESQKQTKKVITHVPGGGTTKIYTRKLNFDKNAKSKVGSKDNENHVPDGGKTKIYDKTTSFKQNAKARIASGFGETEELTENQKKVNSGKETTTTLAEITKPLNRYNTVDSKLGTAKVTNKGKDKSPASATTSAKNVVEPNQLTKPEVDNSKPTFLKAESILSNVSSISAKSATSNVSKRSTSPGEDKKISFMTDLVSKDEHEVKHISEDSEDHSGTLIRSNTGVSKVTPIVYVSRIA